VEALLPETPRVYRAPSPDEYDYEYGYDYEGDEEEEDPGDVEIPPVSLCQQLPYSLQHLIIIDDHYLQGDTIRLDGELRNLMLDAQFSKLRAIRVRRQIPWSKYVKDLGWHEERYGRYWNALLRPGSLSDSDT
jgi:hypothetical protein